MLLLIFRKARVDLKNLFYYDRLRLSFGSPPDTAAAASAKCKVTCAPKVFRAGHRIECVGTMPRLPTNARRRGNDCRSWVALLTSSLPPELALANPDKAARLISHEITTASSELLQSSALHVRAGHLVCC